MGVRRGAYWRAWRVETCLKLKQDERGIVPPFKRKGKGTLKGDGAAGVGKPSGSVVEIVL
jgi:hypothetical protein